MALPTCQGGLSLLLVWQPARPSLATRTCWWCTGRWMSWTRTSRPGAGPSAHGAQEVVLPLLREFVDKRRATALECVCLLNARGLEMNEDGTSLTMRQRRPRTVPRMADNVDQSLFCLLFFFKWRRWCILGCGTRISFAFS